MRDLYDNDVLQLLRARVKRAAVPMGDPAMNGAPPADPSMGGAPPGAPPMDPSMGGAPPMDPSAGGAPPMDPSAGGAPPMDPSMAGGMPPGVDPSSMGMPPPPPGPDIATMVTQAVQQAISGAGLPQSGQNAAGAIKPKIDINTTMVQILKILARIADALGVKIPASEMVVSSGDLTSFAKKQESSGQQDAAMSSGPGAPIGGLPPMPGVGDVKQGADRMSAAAKLAQAKRKLANCR